MHTDYATVFNFTVVSRGVCKFRDRLLLPGCVKVTDNAVDDPVNASRILETAHRLGSAADLAEGAFYSIGGAGLAPVGFGTA